MCTTNEWREFNKDRSRKSLRDKVSNLILTDQFWNKAKEVQIIMEPLVKVLKLVDQDKKPALSIIYEAMDRAKLAIKASVKHWERLSHPHPTSGRCSGHPIEPPAVTSNDSRIL